MDFLWFSYKNPNGSTAEPQVLPAMPWRNTRPGVERPTALMTGGVPMALETSMIWTYIYIYYSV